MAQSDETVVIENNHYFPAGAVNKSHLQPSTTTTKCPWKGTAHYYTVSVGGKENPDAAWYYPDPNPPAAEIKDRIASGGRESLVGDNGLTPPPLESRRADGRDKKKLSFAPKSAKLKEASRFSYSCCPLGGGAQECLTCNRYWK